MIYFKYGKSTERFKTIIEFADDTHKNYYFNSFNSMSGANRVKELICFWFSIV